MSVYATIETAVSLHRLVNYGLKQQGVYCVRVWLGCGGARARPFNTLKAWGKRTACLQESRLDYDSGCYYSPCYLIRYDEEEVQVNEFVFFRTELESYRNEGFTQSPIEVHAELLMCELCDYKEGQPPDFKVLAQYEGRTSRPVCLHSFLPIQFERRFVGVLSGLISSSLLEFKFRSKDKAGSSFVSFLQEATNLNLTLVKQLYDFYFEHAQREYSTLCAKYEARLQFLKTGADPVPEFRRAEPAVFYERMRNKDFQFILSELNSVAQSTYDLWNRFIELTANSHPFITQHQKDQYKEKLNQQWAWFILRFKSKRATNWYREDHIAECERLADQMRKKADPPESLQIMNVALTPSREIQPVIFEEISEGGELAIQTGKHLIFLVHGFEANRFDLFAIKNMLVIAYPNVEVVCSQANEGQTGKSIDLQGRALAIEIANVVGRKGGARRLSFIGHSMGGLIVRSMVPYLDEKLRDCLHMYCSLATPHLGFSYGASRLLEAGLWYLNTMERVTSIEQLSMNDTVNKKSAFLYELSNNRAFSYFNRIVLVGSAQDGYIPLESARVEMSSEAITDRIGFSEKGQIYCRMTENMFRGVTKATVHRLEVNFVVREGGTLDKLIGRTAHIKLIQDNSFLSMLTSCFDHIFQ